MGLDSSGPAWPPSLLGRSLVIEQAEAQNVRRIFEWYASGLGVELTIVSRLNQLGPGEWKPGSVRRTGK